MDRLYNFRITVFDHDDRIFCYEYSKAKNKIDAIRQWNRAHDGIKNLSLERVENISLQRKNPIKNSLCMGFVDMGQAARF